jgi:CxxC motif-containing protein
MIKKLTCIECPKGCGLSVDVENCKVVRVQGYKCPKGEHYAAAEVENPVRILTSAVLTRGLDIKMLPVRTDKPIPKSKLMEAMREIKGIKVEKSVQSGEIIVKNFLGLGVDLVVTRDVM